MYNSTKLVQMFKLNCNIPNNSNVLTESQILDYFNEELSSTIIPIMIKLKGSFSTKISQLTYNSENKCRIPDRAVGTVVKDVFTKTGSNRNYLSPVEEADLSKYYISDSATFIRAFYLEDNYIVPLPYGANETIYCSYLCRPSKLVTASRTVEILTVDTATKTVTFTAKPANFNDNELYDVVTFRPGSEIKKIDLSVASSTSTSITFNESISDVEAGDILSLAGETLYPNFTEEVHSLLLYSTCCKFLETQPDREQLAILLKRKEELTKSILESYNDRVKDKPKFIRPNIQRWK